MTYPAIHAAYRAFEPVGRHPSPHVPTELLHSTRHQVPGITSPGYVDLPPIPAVHREVAAMLAEQEHVRAARVPWRLRLRQFLHRPVARLERALRP